jgi:hypothetical protein
VVCTTASAQTADWLKVERGYFVGATAQRTYDTSELRQADEAYKFFYPTICSEAVTQQTLAAGGKVNEAGIVMATGPRQQFALANPGTPYAIANDASVGIGRTEPHCLG